MEKIKNRDDNNKEKIIEKFEKLMKKSKNPKVWEKSKKSKQMEGLGKNPEVGRKFFKMVEMWKEKVKKRTKMGKSAKKQEIL